MEGRRNQWRPTEGIPGRRWGDEDVGEERRAGQAEEAQQRGLGGSTAQVRQETGRLEKRKLEGCGHAGRGQRRAMLSGSPAGATGHQLETGWGNQCEPNVGPGDHRGGNR